MHIYTYITQRTQTQPTSEDTLHTQAQTDCISAKECTYVYQLTPTLTTYLNACLCKRAAGQLEAPVSPSLVLPPSVSLRTTHSGKGVAPLRETKQGCACVDPTTPCQFLRAGFRPSIQVQSIPVPRHCCKSMSQPCPRRTLLPGPVSELVRETQRAGVCVYACAYVRERESEKERERKRESEREREIRLDAHAHKLAFLVYAQANQASPSPRDSLSCSSSFWAAARSLRTVLTSDTGLLIAAISNSHTCRPNPASERRTLRQAAFTDTDVLQTRKSVANKMAAPRRFAADIARSPRGASGLE